MNTRVMLAAQPLPLVDLLLVGLVLSLVAVPCLLPYMWAGSRGTDANAGLVRILVVFSCTSYFDTHVLGVVCSGVLQIPKSWSS